MGVTVSVTIFFIGWNTYRFSYSVTMGILSVGYLWVGFIDLLYTRLISAQDFQTIPIDSYLQALIQAILPLFPGTERIRVELKYAFVGRDKGAIQVTLKREEKHFVLIVQDDGVGIRKSVGSKGGFGLELVRMLSTQLGGNFSIAGTNGTRCIVTFPIPESLPSPE